MEKKSSSKGRAPEVRRYTVPTFDEEASAAPEPPAPSAPEPPLVSEEERQARSAARIAARESEGYERGYAAGLEQGRAQGSRELEETALRLEGLLRSLEGFREKRVGELLPDLVDLSVEIARKIIHKEVELDREVIVAVAQDALQKVGEKEESVVVKVNPLDYEIMLSRIDFLKSQSGLKEIAVEPYAAIAPGGCYIETRTGEVDARIEEQLKEVQDAVNAATDTEV